MHQFHLECFSFEKANLQNILKTTAKKNGKRRMFNIQTDTIQHQSPLSEIFEFVIKGISVVDKKEDP